MPDLLVAAQSNKPGSTEFAFIRGDAKTGYGLHDWDLGNVAWEKFWSGPRGTQGARLAGGEPLNRPLVIDFRVTGFGATAQARADDLAAKQARISTLAEDLRRFGGRVTVRLKGASYRFHYQALAGEANVADYDWAHLNIYTVIHRLEAICAPYLLGDPMDVTDDFSTNRIDEYAYDAGANGVRVDVPPSGLAGELVPNLASLSTEVRLLHTAYGYTYGDTQATIAARAGDSSTGYKAGVILKRIDASNYLEAYRDYDGVNTRIRIDKVVAGARTNLATANVGAGNSVGEKRYVRGRIEGNVVFAEYFTSPPTPTLTPTTAVNYTLSVSEAVTFGATARGRAGIVFTPFHSNATIDDLKIEPFVYRVSQQPEEIELAGGIPGDAPALCDLEVTPDPSGVIRPWFAFAWWEKPLPWSMVWNGDFGEDVNGWTVASITGSGAASSITRVTDALFLSGFAGEVVTPATADVGAKFRINRRFKRGKRYVVEADIRAPSGSTTNVYLRFVSTDGTSFTGSSQALTANRATLSLSFLLAADEESAYVAVNIAAATATTFRISAVRVYEEPVQGVAAYTPSLRTQILGRGAPPPIGILEAEDNDVGDLVESGLSTYANGDFGAPAGYRQAQALTAVLDSAGSSTATWFVDPSLLVGDDYAADEFAVEVYAKMELTSSMGTITALLSAIPELGTGFGAERYTDEFGSAGKTIVYPGTVTQQTYRLGTLRFVALRSNPSRWKLKLVMAWTGTSGSWALDNLLLLPLRSRALSPTGRDYSTVTYPVFVASTTEQTRIIRSDLSGVAQKPAAGEFPSHGLGGSLLELPPGDLVMIARQGQIPDQANTPGAADPVQIAMTIHPRVTPRFLIARP